MARRNRGDEGEQRSPAADRNMDNRNRRRKFMTGGSGGEGGLPGEERRTDFNAGTVANQRARIAEAIFNSMINPSDIGGIQNLLTELGVSKYKDGNPAGGLSHNWKLWSGMLDPEGYGMYNAGTDREHGALGNIPKVIWDEVFEPALNRMQRGLSAGHFERDPESGLLFNRDPGGNTEAPDWFDVFGRKVGAPYAGAIKFGRDGKPIQQTKPAAPGNTDPMSGNPMGNAASNVSKPKQPQKPTPAFYGSTTPNYGLGMGGMNPRPTARPRPPAWYSTWRY